MWSPPQKPVGVGVVKQQWQQQQSEQPRRTPSLEKSSVSHYFEGWNAGSLSLPSGSGLRPPHAPSPQPSPKTQLSPSNPFESRRPLRLGEHPQGNLRLPTNTNDDDDFFALAKPETNHEFALSRTPTIELHPAPTKPAQGPVPTPVRGPSPLPPAPTPTPSSSEKDSYSEASSFAYCLRRERTSKKTFKKVMVSPPHLSLTTPARPAPPRSIVSSPAIVMQSAPPSPGFQPIAKSMTFSEAVNKTRHASPHHHDADHGHISFRNSKLKNRRVRASIGLGASVAASIPRPTNSGPFRGRYRSSISRELSPPAITPQRSSDAIPIRDIRRRPGHPGNPVSFVSAVGSVGESIEQGQEEAKPSPPPEEPPKQGFLRVLTVHSIVPGPIRREATKLMQNESPYRRQSKQASAVSRPPTPEPICFGLFSSRSRRRGTHSSIQTSDTGKGKSSKRKESYVASDGREYPSRAVPGLSFLPSEMQRVNTPPMGGALMSPGSKSRGFFFDYTNPPGVGDEPETRRDSVAGSMEHVPWTFNTPWEAKANGMGNAKGAMQKPDYF
ncbi:hypothetical protein D6C77_04049 [Aureobasidium pullulans]|nr:hypothetical protein D6C77_04049 [Aureobasidium pullulans]